MIRTMLKYLTLSNHNGLHYRSTNYVIRAARVPPIRHTASIVTEWLAADRASAGGYPKETVDVLLKTYHTHSISIKHYKCEKLLRLSCSHIATSCSIQPVTAWRLEQIKQLSRWKKWCTFTISSVDSQILIDVYFSFITAGKLSTENCCVNTRRHVAKFTVNIIN